MNICFLKKYSFYATESRAFLFSLVFVFFLFGAKVFSFRRGKKFAEWTTELVQRDMVKTLGKEVKNHTEKSELETYIHVLHCLTQSLG